MRRPCCCQATIRGVNAPLRSPPPPATPTSEPGHPGLPPSSAGSAPPELTLAPPVTHYENFPVASLLCPPHLRQPIAAIYAFARTADDLADEGDAAPTARLADLAAFQADLAAVASGAAPSARPVCTPG